MLLGDRLRRLARDKRDRDVADDHNAFADHDRSSQGSDKRCLARSDKSLFHLGVSFPGRAKPRPNPGPTPAQPRPNPGPTQENACLGNQDVSNHIILWPTEPHGSDNKVRCFSSRTGLSSVPV